MYRLKCYNPEENYYEDLFSEDKNLLEEIEMDRFIVDANWAGIEAINTWISDYAYYEEIHFNEAKDIIMKDKRAITNRARAAWDETLIWYKQNITIEEVPVI